jgi:hypothetical protein
VGDFVVAFANPLTCQIVAFYMGGIMERIQIIHHKGARIHFWDFSGLSPGKEMQALLNKVVATAQSQPENSVRELTDVTGAHFDTQMLNSLKELSTSVAPYVRASAMIGTSGLLHVALSAVRRVSKRNIKVFDSREEALDWLAAQ